MSEQLRPCPFCGGTGLALGSALNFNKDKVEYWIECANCQTQGPICKSPFWAVKKWNTRTADRERELMRQPDPPDISREEAERQKRNVETVMQVAAKGHQP